MILPSVGFKRKVLMNTSFGNFLLDVGGIHYGDLEKILDCSDCILYYFLMYYNTHTKDDFIVNLMP